MLLFSPCVLFSALGQILLEAWQNLIYTHTRLGVGFHTRDWGKLVLNVSTKFLEDEGAELII